MAKKVSAIARRTISLPRDLDRRMEKTAGVNWSEVARLAFEARLSELTPPKELKEMANVINRLRELAKEETSAAEKAGIECGREWAKETATPKELRRLDEFRSDRNYEESMLMIDGQEGAPSLNVLSAIQGSEADWRDAEEFFSSESQPMLSEEGFATGFVDGALEVWHQVKDAI